METKEFRGPGFALMIPTEWLISSSLDFQAIFLAPRHADSTQANLTISMRQLEAGATLDAVLRALRDTQTRAYPQFRLIGEYDFSQEGGSGFMQRYRWQNTNQNAAFVQTQALFLVERILFTLTGTAPEQHADSYDGLFEKMVESFRVIA